MTLYQRLRSLANRFGVDVMRLHQSPRQSMLGLPGRNILTVIDCGANEGQYAKQIVRRFPGADVYCFEPLPAAFAKLEQWCQGEGGRVRCFNLALGEQPGEVVMHQHDEHTASSSVLNSTRHGHETFPQTRAESLVHTPMETLDGVLRPYLPKMRRNILLKLDVQGYEDRVLRGAREVLAACAYCVLEVNVDSLYEGQAQFAELVRILDESGLQYAGNVDQVHAPDGRAIYLDACFRRRGLPG